MQIAIQSHAIGNEILCWKSLSNYLYMQNLQKSNPQISQATQISHNTQFSQKDQKVGNFVELCKIILIMLCKLPFHENSKWPPEKQEFYESALKRLPLIFLIKLWSSVKNVIEKVDGDILIVTIIRSYFLLNAILTSVDNEEEEIDINLAKLNPNIMKKWPPKLNSIKHFFETFVVSNDNNDKEISKNNIDIDEDENIYEDEDIDETEDIDEDLDDN